MPWREAVVCIENAEGSAFGTAFVFDRRDGRSYLLTCHHVWQEIGGEQGRLTEWPEARLRLESREGSDFLDMAVFSVEGLPPLRVLPLSENGVPGRDFETCGYSAHNPNKSADLSKRKRRLFGTLGEDTPLVQAGQRVRAWDLSIRETPERNKKFTKLLPGYSGSPIWDVAAQRVVGVISERAGHDAGHGLDISNLCAVFSQYAELSDSQPPAAGEYPESDHWIVSTIDRRAQFGAIKQALAAEQEKARRWSAFLFAAAAEDCPEALAKRARQHLASKRRDRSTVLRNLTLGRGRDAFREALLEHLPHAHEVGDQPALQQRELSKWLQQDEDKLFYAALLSEDSQRQKSEIVSAACELLGQLTSDNMPGRVLVFFGSLQAPRKNRWWPFSAKLPQCPQLPEEAQLEALGRVTREHVAQWLKDDAAWRGLPFEPRKLRRPLMRLFDEANSDSLHYGVIHEYLVEDDGLRGAQ